MAGLDLAFVTLRRADARFLLPSLPSSAVVAGDVAGWREALAEAAVDAPSRGNAPDLAVGRPDHVDDAIATGAGAVIVEGRGGARALRAAGYRLQRWVPIPTLQAPEILIPLDHPAAARYALRRWIVPDERWKKARNRALEELAARGLWVPRVPLVTIATKRPSLPAFLRSAATLGVETSDYFVTFGGADDLARGVFFVFPKDSASPRWVVKFARVAGYTKAFDLDERGLDVAARAGGVVARHAPRAAGRLRIDGIEASVETAAVGERLVNFLKAPAPDGPKIAAIERIARWLIAVAGATAGPATALDDERHRLRAEVMPRWTQLGVAEDLVELTAEVRPVLRRGDLGSWNVVVSDDGFTAVDWETAMPHGYPLWDLLYFLTDSLALVDGAWDDDARDDHVARLWRGEARHSGMALDWVRAAAAASSLRPHEVGPVATLLWLSVGIAHMKRAEEMARRASTGRVVIPPAERVAPLWMSDPLLGPGWAAWRR